MKRKNRSILMAGAAALALMAAGVNSASALEVIASQHITPGDLSAIVTSPNPLLQVRAVETGAADQLFIIYVDQDGEKFFIDYNTATNDGDLALTATQIGTQLQAELGGPVPGNLFFLESVARFDATNQELVIGFSIDPTEKGLIALDVTTTPWTARLIALDEDLEELADHDILPNGNIVVALEGDGVAEVDRLTGDVTVRITEADLLALGPFTELPAESLAVDPSSATGAVYIFAHDDKQLFLSDNFGSTTAPTAPNLSLLTATEIPGLQPGVVDFHGIVVDNNGNIIAIDEAAEELIIYPAGGGAPVALDFGDLGALAGGAPGEEFEPTLWSGLAVRTLSPDSFQVVLASSTDEFGVLLITFGPAASVSDWMMMAD